MRSEELKKKKKRESEMTWTLIKWYSFVYNLDHLISICVQDEIFSISVILKPLYPFSLVGTDLRNNLLTY